MVCEKIAYTLFMKADETRAKEGLQMGCPATNISNTTLPKELRNLIIDMNSRIESRELEGGI